MGNTTSENLVFYSEFFENFTSEHTRSSYKSDIRKFFIYLDEIELKIKKYSTIDRSHIIKYCNFLTETGGVDGRPCAPKTIARKLASLSSYFDFLVEKGECDFNPVTSVKRPRREVLKPTNALSAEQVREIFDIIDLSSKSGHLHKALLITFFTTGLRKSEILNLKFKDYREINDYRVVEFKGKGGKVGQKLLHEDCAEAMEAYLAWMQKENRGHESEDWLFQPTRNPQDPTNLNKH